MKNVVNEINVNVERRISGIAQDNDDKIFVKLGTMGPKGLPFVVVVRHDADQEEASSDNAFPDVVHLWMPSEWASKVADALEEAVRQLRRLEKRL